MTPSVGRRRNPALRAAIFLVPAAVVVVVAVLFINWPATPPPCEVNPADCPPPPPPPPSRLRVFIDASASMAGYFEGKTEFKDHLARIVADLPKAVGGSDPRPQVSYIFSAETDEAFTGSPEELITRVLDGKVITGGSSMLQQVLSRITSSITRDEVVMIVTDGLFSYSNEEVKKSPEINRVNIGGLAAQVQLLLQSPGWATKKMTPALAILQYTSRFNGTYYTYRNDRVKCCETPRPYYIWVLGDAPRVQRVFNSLRRTRGLEPRHSLLLGPHGASPRPRALVYSLREGNWLPVRGRVLGLERVSPPSLVTMALDLGELPEDVVTREYVNRHLDKQRMRTDFAAVEVAEFAPRVKLAGQFNARDSEMLEGATHFLTLRIIQLAVDRATVTLAVANELPAWCRDADTSDDTQPGVEGKTFGFLPIVEGAARALRSGEPLFSFELVLEK